MGCESQLTDQPVDELTSSNQRTRGEMSCSEILYAWQKIARDEVNNAYVSEACRYLYTPSCKLLRGSNRERDIGCRGEEERKAYKTDAPVLITHWPSSLTRIHWLASSNSKSCKSSIRFAYSGSFLRLRFRFLASHSGSGRAVEEPEMVYTGTAE